MKPRAIPAEITALAEPSLFPENQMAQTLCKFIGMAAATSPVRKTVAVIVTRPFDNPLNAPATPIRRHAMANVLFVPKRSPIIPPARPASKPANETLPQTAPTWTRLNWRSLAISEKSTGIAIDGAATARVAVAPERTSMYQRYLEQSVSRFMLITGLLSRALPAKIVADRRRHDERDETGNGQWQLTWSVACEFGN